MEPRAVLAASLVESQKLGCSSDLGAATLSDSLDAHLKSPNVPAPSIRARAIEAIRVLEPFWIDKLGGGAGRGIGPDGLPVRQIGAGLDHDGLIGEEVEGEAVAARFQTRAARGDLRRAQHRGGQAAAVCSPAGGAGVVRRL